jgi:hypothetical protein
LVGSLLKHSRSYGNAVFLQVNVITELGLIQYNLKSKRGEVIDLNSLLTAVRSREVEERDGLPQLRDQRVFGSFLRSKRDNRAAGELMNTDENIYDVNKWLF